MGDKQTVAPSKDVLPCKQLPLQDKLVLELLHGVLISSPSTLSGQADTQDFSGHHDE